MSWAIDLAERRVVPDPLVRVGMRRLLGQRRLREERAQRRPSAMDRASRRSSRRWNPNPWPLPPGTPTSSTTNSRPSSSPRCSGRTSSTRAASGPMASDDLAQAEDRMLELTCERAGIEDGMDVLDLGCGWGSFSLWVARHYPGCRVLAVSNSRTQAEFIRARCAREGLDRGRGGDRRHERLRDRPPIRPGGVGGDVRAHAELGAALRAGGRAGCARTARSFSMSSATLALPTSTATTAPPTGWPATSSPAGSCRREDLPRRYDDHLEVVDQWRVSGLHYSQTLEAWLDADGSQPGSV